MVLLNVLVVAKEDSKTLLGWEIIRCLFPEATFETLFRKKLLPRINPLPCPRDQVQLESCFVGKEKHQLDKMSVDLPIADVVTMFGPYIKFFVTFAHQAPDLVPCPPVLQAFDVMMLAQRSLSVPTAPSRILSCSKKDDLYNAVVGLLEQENLKLVAGDANGKCLLKSLTNVLWYIDGRHESLEKRSCQVPVIFPQFQGYNQPELSKHRKREHTNMTSSELKALASDLFTILMCSFWKQPQWLAFKLHVEGLAKCLVDYSDYLDESNKKMKLRHLSTVPSRQLTNNLSISFLPLTELQPSKLDDLNMALSSAEDFEYIDVGECSPSDAHKKYKYIKKVMNGFSVPCCLLTYSAGGNVGHLNFIWRVSGVEKEDFAKSLPIIETIKEKIPTFHTRAMRRALFMKFG